MQYRMIRDKIVDFSEWPSKQLPIIYVDGDSYYIEGRQYTKSFVHDARDSQKLLNYARSETAAELKNRRREQWIGTPDNIIGYEQQWRNPETQNGILMARPDPKTGAMPMKMPAWDVSQGLFMTSQSATQDMREVIGFSENEQPQADISGRARRERKLEGSMASYVFFDNLNQAMAQGGRIVNDVLPYIVGDDERHMSVSRKNGKNESILLNERKDNKILNRIQKGDFDVEIDTGASFAVQKEIALEFLQQTLQAFPQAFPLIADLWAKNLDVQFMEQITERFKTLVPPEVLAKEEGREPPPKQPSPQDQMMAMQQQMAQQKMQLDAQQLAERAENLKLSKKRHELEEAELMMRAHEMKEKMNIERDKMSAEGEKSNMDFVTEIAKIVADAHK
jgi:hypothetical protein